MDNYTANPAAIQSPSPAPRLGTSPIVALSQDGIDDVNYANFAQRSKVLADNVGWLIQGHGEAFRESFMWADDGTSYTANQSPVTGYAPATLWVSDVSGSITLVGAGTGSNPMMSRALQFTPPSASNSCFYSTTPKMVGFGNAGSGLTIANFYWSLRFATKFSVVPSTANSFYFAGIHSTRAWAPSGNTNGGMFGIRYWGAQAAHWQFIMDANVVTLAAGQDPVGGTWQFWDIEWFGQSTQQGVLHGSQFGRLSLNGSVVATINAAPSTGSGNRYIVMGANTDTGSAGASFFTSAYVSRWTIDV